MVGDSNVSSILRNSDLQISNSPEGVLLRRQWAPSLLASATVVFPKPLLFVLL